MTVQTKVKLRNDGIRLVFRSYGDGESWQKNVIIPREHLIRQIRYLRARGWSYHDCDWWNLIPDDIAIHSYYHGPGMGFAHDAWYRDTKRYRTIYQTGGLDV